MRLSEPVIYLPCIKSVHYTGRRELKCTGDVQYTGETSLSTLEGVQYAQGIS